MAISLTGMHCCYAEVYILIQQVSHMNKNRKIQVLNLRTMNDIIKGNALSGLAMKIRDLRLVGNNCGGHI